jgi:hypothetical protein
MAIEAATMDSRDGIEATVNYIARSAEPLFAYAYESPPGMPQKNAVREPHSVRIADARQLQPPASLEREGFSLRRHRTAVANFYDEDEVRRVCYPEVERLVREATGASDVMVFDHDVRNTAPERQIRKLVKAAAASVHNDYTECSAPRRVRELLAPADAEARLKRRYLVINVWRPITGPVESWPLALCSAQSLDWSDLTATEWRYPDRVGRFIRSATTHATAGSTTRACASTKR